MKTNEVIRIGLRLVKTNEVMHCGINPELEIENRKLIKTLKIIGKLQIYN